MIKVYNKPLLDICRSCCNTCFISSARVNLVMSNKE